MSQSNCETGADGYARPNRDQGFLLDVERELGRAREKFGDIASLHEGYSVILEELDEFWEGVKTKGTHPAALRAELIQVAAMACRCATDRKLG